MSGNVSRRLKARRRREAGNNAPCPVQEPFEIRAVTRCITLPEPVSHDVVQSSS